MSATTQIGNIKPLAPTLQEKHELTKESRSAWYWFHAILSEEEKYTEWQDYYKQGVRAKNNPLGYDKFFTNFTAIHSQWLRRGSPML